MNIFYIKEIRDSIGFMDSGESRHCARVLRMNPGDTIRFMDGRGGMYEGVLIDNNPEKCRVEIQNVLPGQETRPYFLHLAIAPVKQFERFEWFLEKAVEIGVDRITPLITDHSERRKIRMDRMERIILSAAKQSLKAWLPDLDDLTPFEDFIRQSGLPQYKYIAHCGDGEKDDLLRILSPEHALIMIGPEGDFSENEVVQAVTNDFRPVSLGKSRLRTETAGVVAAQIMADKAAFKAIK